MILQTFIYQHHFIVNRCRVNFNLFKANFSIFSSKCNYYWVKKHFVKVNQSKQYKSASLNKIVINNCSLFNQFSTSISRFSSSNETLFQNISQPFAVLVEDEQRTEQQLFQIDSINESLIDENEIKQRQINLIKLASEWLKTFTSQKSQRSPLILIISSPFQYQGNTKIPVLECKQSSDFTYFTGLHSGSSDQLTSDCVLLLFLEDPNQIDSIRSVIFSPTKTKSEVLWNGPGLHYQYKEWLNKICQEIYPLSEFVPFLNRHFTSYRRDLFLSRKGLQYRPELVTHLRCFLRNSSSLDEAVLEKWPSNLGQTLHSVYIRDASIFIDQLRLIKSTKESDALKRVGKIGSIALHETINWSRKMLNTNRSFTFLESHIEAKFLFESKLYGARKLSFPSICASGPRATIIHYGRNDHSIRIDEENCWILTDVGCEDVDGYCCDITRTWPINLTKNNNNEHLQLQLYEALAELQKMLINSIDIGKTSLNDLNKLMFNLLGKLLLSFNVFNCTISKEEISTIVKKICAHHVSHYLGK